MRGALVGALVLALVACEKSAPAPPAPAPAPAPAPGASAKAPTPAVAVASPDFLHVQGADYQGIIAQTRGSWTPSPQDIAELEAVLGPALAAHAMGKQFPPSQFLRQYIGGERAGVRSIWVELHCEARGADWKTRGFPEVMGGGKCYGSADYDVATRKVTDIEHNSLR